MRSQEGVDSRSMKHVPARHQNPSNAVMVTTLLMPHLHPLTLCSLLLDALGILGWANASC